MKKRRLSWSGAAGHLITATKAEQLGVGRTVGRLESPRIFQARHAAGERVDRNLRALLTHPLRTFTASDNTCSACMESSQLRQASVMLWP
jgi:hypothetical protein